MEELCAPKALQSTPNGVMLGYFCPNVRAERFTTAAPGLTTTDYESNRAVAKMAEELGLSFALTIGRWRGIPGDSIGYATAGLDTYTLIAALLEATERISLISTTHTAVWNPVIAAKLGADLDQIGRGRWGLNVVAGWHESEFRSMGVRLFDHDQRYAQADHWLAAVRELWCQGESSYKCEFFELDGAECRPGPVQAGGPVVINAGASPTGMDFAKRNANFLFGNWQVGERFAEVRGDADVGYIGERRFVIADTDAEAHELANVIVRDADLLALARGRARQVTPDGRQVPEEDVYLQLKQDDELRRRIVLADAFVGSPETIAREMAAWLTSSPVDGVCMAMFDFERDLELFGTRTIEPLGNMLADAGKVLVLRR